MENTKTLIQLAKENLIHLYPNLTFINIDMIRLENNDFKSKIRLSTKLQSFFVSKEGSNYKQSLTKSCKAVIKQLEKAKINKVHLKSTDLSYECEEDDPSEDLL